ncbi:MAG: ATP-binding protein [Planctomycetota bacterium]|jgi:signal transduction histidine kinase
MEEHDKQEPQADGTAVEDLSATLESLVDASQRSAEQLAQLLERSERVQSEIAERGAALERQLSRDAGVDDDGPGEDRTVGPVSPADEEAEAARAVAEGANRAKSCFLAAMARELRTPVDGLARMIELLKQTDLDDEQRRYLRTASHSVCALLALLDSVLSVSNVDTGIADLRSTDFDLRRVLEETVELLVPAARKKGLLLSCQVQPEVPTLLRSEPGRLQQIVLYAVRRAIQFAAHGEIAVDASVEESGDLTTTIRFTIDHGDTAVSPDELNHAFAPNAHLEGPCGSEGNRGLGLTIAKRITELMGGRIDVESADRGYSIWFVLPLDNYRKPADDRRAHGRLPQELLQCNLGPVLDLSMGGMRVQCSKAPKGRVEVELMDTEGPVKIRAEVMWTRRLRFRKYEVGLYFPHVAPDVAKQLTRVSLNHRLRRLLGIT